MGGEFPIASLQDVPRLVQLVNSAYRGESSKQGWTTEAELLEGIRTDEKDLGAMLSQPDSIILMHTDEDELLGCVYLQKQEEYYYLGMLTVKPVCQTRGIGKKLMRAAEEYAKQNGGNAIVMTVISVRSELIEWYERRGYQTTGEVKPFVAGVHQGIQKQPLEFVVMKKQL